MIHILGWLFQTLWLTNDHLMWKILLCHRNIIIVYINRGPHTEDPFCRQCETIVSRLNSYKYTDYQHV